MNELAIDLLVDLSHAARARAGNCAWRPWRNHNSRGENWIRPVLERHAVTVAPCPFCGAEWTDHPHVKGVILTAFGESAEVRCDVCSAFVIERLIPSKLASIVSLEEEDDPFDIQVALLLGALHRWNQRMAK